MAKVKIQVFQMIVMVVLFQLGNTIVIGVGRNAKQHAWLALLIGMIVGLLLIYIYIWIYSLREESTFTDLLVSGFGKYAGRLIAFFYAGFFLYNSARITSDFAFFIENQLAIPKIWVVKLLIILLIGYVGYLGIEALARSSEIFFFITFAFLFLLFLLFFSDHIFELNNIRPVLAIDRSALLKTVFPLIIMVPFGEAVVFLCFFHFVNDFKIFRKMGWIPVMITGSILALIAFINYGVLSEELLKDVTFPFIIAIQHITFLDFLTHFEIIAIIIFMMGGVIKIAIYFFAGMMTLTQTFSVSSEKRLIIPSVMVMYVISYFFMDNYVEHIHIGSQFLPKYIYPIFQIYLPVSLLLILFVKSKIKKWIKRKVFGTA